MTSANQQHAFLYMPDISGFTQFVTETEIEHSTHIIQELLEIIIAGNHLNMELIEIEGDAVFFLGLVNHHQLKKLLNNPKVFLKNFTCTCLSMNNSESVNAEPAEQLIT